jgi:hypothetical protein
MPNDIITQALADIDAAVERQNAAQAATAAAHAARLAAAAESMRAAEAAAAAEAAEIAEIAAAQAAIAVAAGRIRTANAPPPPVPTYSLTAGSGMVDEGASLEVTLLTTHVAAGTAIGYTITGLSAADAAALDGTFIVGDDGTATTLVVLTADQLTEGTEGALLTLDGGLASVVFDVLDASQAPPPPPTYTLTAASVIDEGKTAVFELWTTGVAAGASVSYVLQGDVTAADVSAPLAGAFVITDGGYARIDVPIRADLATEGDEALVCRLVDIGIQAETIIRDTSVTPAPAPPPAPVPPPAPGEPIRYRTQHRNLFQGAARPVKPPVISGLPGYGFGGGPNLDHVDYDTGWRWDQRGGDWLDADGVRHGPKPWASVRTRTGGTEPAAYTLDVTALVQRAQTDDRWLALRLTSGGGYRQIAGRWDARRPVMSVTYDDGTTAELPIVLAIAPGPSTPAPNADKLQCPVFMEFDRPAKPVTSATLTVTCLTHTGSAVTSLHAWLLDPPVNAAPVQQGVASQAGALDDGIDALPAVIGAHRYEDGRPGEDFIYPQTLNTWASREFDPVLWGGTPDTTKLPHRALGKIITTNGAPVSVVPSTYADEGFQPLAPGLGALRAHMPQAAFANGDFASYSGTGGANANLFLPEHLFGRLSRIFVRQYIRIADLGRDGYLRDSERHRLAVYCSRDAAGNLIDPKWVDMAGKFCSWTPNHTTSIGSGTGSSGGTRGWQMRQSWADCDHGARGPNEGGVRLGWHLYDFSTHQPEGHKYHGDNASKTQFGQRGGLGGVLYADQWYCVESEVALNSIEPWAADGVLRTWIDGRLVYEREGMTFRDKPYPAIPKPDQILPVRDLGVRGLWLNWYHGGVTTNPVPRTTFLAGLVWSTEYIGPMKLG